MYICFNIIGPTIITQLLNGQIEIKLGDLRPTRDFVYVEDTAKGFAQIANSESANDELKKKVAELSKEAWMKQKSYQDLLIAELNHRVKNILALVRFLGKCFGPDDMAI